MTAWHSPVYLSRRAASRARRSALFCLTWLFFFLAPACKQHSSPTPQSDREAQDWAGKAGCVGAEGLAGDDFVAWGLLVRMPQKDGPTIRAGCAQGDFASMQLFDVAVAHGIDSALDVTAPEAAFSLQTGVLRLAGGVEGSAALP